MTKGKDWTGNSKAVYVTLGASNHVEEERQIHDFYATSGEASEWLLKIEPQLSNVWECAVGQGDLAEPYRREGKLKAISDLIDRGYYPEDIMTSYGKDFLQMKKVWKGDIVTNPPYACYDKETQVKTKNGWKYFYELDGSEEILSVNPVSLDLEWSKICKKHEYDIDEDIIHFKNRLQDLMVTPNHRMFVYSYRDLIKGQLKPHLKNGRVRTAKDVNKGSGTPKWGYQWKGFDQEIFCLKGCILYENSPREYTTSDINIRMEDWLKFFGLWLADGSCSHTKNLKGNQRYCTSIGQNIRTVPQVKLILDALPFEYSLRQDVNTDTYHFIIESKQLWMYLSKFGYSRDKYVPTFIKELPVDKLRLFLSSYLLGDSTRLQIGEQKHKTKTNGCKISSVSRKLIDDLHEIVFKLGYLVSSIATYSEKTCLLYNFNYFYERKKQQNCIKYSKKNIVHYKGKVYCVTLEKNGFMLVRRNDKINVCGNSALPFIKKALNLVKDGRYVAMFLKTTFLEGKERRKFFEENPPIRIWVSSSRIVCAKNGKFEVPRKNKDGSLKLDKTGNIIMERPSAAVSYSWFIWQKGYKGDTVVKWFN